MIRVDEIFDVSKEIVEGVNPRTKEPIEITRTVFSKNDETIKFYFDINYVETSLNIPLSEIWDSVLDFDY